MNARLLCAAARAVFGFGAAALADPPKAAPSRDTQDFVYLGDKGPVLLRFHVQIDGKPLVDAWEDFMGRLFAYLDLDGDGVLSKEEAARVPPVQALFNNGPPRLVAARPVLAGRRPGMAGSSLDKNRDGKVTREELADWYRRNGATPFQFRSGNGGNANQFVVQIAGQAQPLPADALNEKLFNLLDANKDGKLSREELARAPALLHKFDLDDDEMVSVQEMSGNVDSGDQFGKVFVAAAFTPDGGGNDKSPFVLVTPGEADKRLAQKLLQHYGSKNKKTGPRGLERKELNLDEQTFARLDADEDGVLDAEELARFAQRDPDLELRVRIGKKGAKEAAFELIASKDRKMPAGASIRSGSDGSVTMEFGSTQIQLGQGESTTDVRYTVAVNQQNLAQFRQADKDNNGYLDKQEAQQSPFFRNLFPLLDRDGDGKVFEKEVVAYFDKMKELQEAAMRSCASVTVKDQGRGLFDLFDANSDGRLGTRELRRMVQLIDQLDRDGDGQISRSEIPHKYRVDVQRGPANSNQLAPRALAIRRFGTTEPALPERTAGPRWFRKMDRNHDGDVSRREFLGTDEEFKKIDTDGDGLISAEEADRADKLFRKDRR